MFAKISDWLEERTGLKEWIKWKKGLPIPKHVNLLYCFGGLSLFIIILQVLTGLYMTFFYIPRPEEALKSIEQMSNDVAFGWLVRNMHRWGATILLATVFSHMVSVFYNKAYKRPRELNWLTGVFQFILVFLLLVTGLLLPWDWRSYWSLAIWMDFLGTWPIVGNYIREVILNTFNVNRSFITHIWILPLLLAILLFFHFRMIKRHGISDPL